MFPKRFSLKTFVAAIALSCICLGLAAIWLQSRRSELDVDAKLRKAGAEVTWGITSDVFEYAMVDQYPDCVMVGRNEEAIFAKFTRRLTESVVAVEWEQTTIDKGDFQLLHRLNNLVFLQLIDCAIEESALQQRLPPGIKWLILDGTPIGSPRSEILSGVKTAEWLEMARCEVTDSTLDQIGNCSQLRVLDLSQNSDITDSGLESLRELRELWMLDLSDNRRITDAGLKALSELKQLKVLKLNNTDITHHGLVQLWPLHKLEYVELVDTRITQEEVESLRHTLPNTEFKTERMVQK